MKLLIYLPFLLLPGLCQADTFTLKDGAKLEGEVTGEMDGIVLVKTKYGSLTINRADIQEQLPSKPAPVPISPMAPAAQLPTAQQEAISISTSPAAEIPAAQQEAVAPAPKLTFQTIQPDTTTLQLVYMENGVRIATETYDSANNLILTEGAMGNGTYVEYYPAGNLKTVKTMMNGKANGTLKAYFPSGALQIEAYYLAGVKEGPFKYYTEDGKVQLEANYKNNLLNGWKREYGSDGAVRSEAYFADGKPAEPPATEPAPAGAAAAAAKEPEAEAVRTITVKVKELTRGEILSFRLNGKFIGKIRLDKDFNVISQDGKVPDGAVKVYGKDGNLEKELDFETNILKALRVYAAGALKAEYSYVEDKAVKK